MLERARQRAGRLGRAVTLELADIKHLRYPDASFDTVTAACVFCSAADPVQGLREADRVVGPNGRICSTSPSGRPIRAWPSCSAR